MIMRGSPLPRAHSRSSEPAWRLQPRLQQHQTTCSDMETFVQQQQQQRSVA
jgi:hypothetical protein